jgi:SAM-dependent methyltransferase
VQTEDFADAEELFAEDYAYFSSISTSWVQHASTYASMMTERLGLDDESFVLEIASNDGYLLQHFVAAEIPCLGVEPTTSTATAAREKGIEVVEEFFGREVGERLACEGRSADLIVANNVLAHVPDINDFVSGFTAALKEDGVATFEFPHLLELVRHAQFDTIYHEHFSYLSLTAVSAVLESNGLLVFDVERIPTHGGSLRVHAQRCDTGTRGVSCAVAELLEFEEGQGVRDPRWYSTLQSHAERIRKDLLDFLHECQRSGKKVAAYGAAAKGSTLLNFAGVQSDLLEYVVDRNPAKQGMYMPGSRIPIRDLSAFSEDPPDFTVILPWNLKSEISGQLLRDETSCGRLVVAVPELSLD